MSFISRINKNLISVLPSVNSVQCVPVRYRYWADKVARGRLLRRFGYNDKIFDSGPLPRLEDAQPLPTPEYRPKNAWSEERALFGQNDYIDILGGGKLHPVVTHYNVPTWLRGVKGSEFQLLLRKKRAYQHTAFPHYFPKTWDNINKRLRYLNKHYNIRAKYVSDD